MENGNFFLKVVLALITAGQAIVIALIAAGQIKLGPDRLYVKPPDSAVITSEPTPDPVGAKPDDRESAKLKGLIDSPDWSFYYLKTNSSDFTDSICSLKAKEALTHLGYSVDLKDSDSVVGRKDHTNAIAYCFAEKSIIVIGAFGTSDADADAHREEFYNALKASLSDYKAESPQ